MRGSRGNDISGCGLLCRIEYVDAKISEKHAIFSFRVFTGFNCSLVGCKAVGILWLVWRWLANRWIRGLLAR